MKTVKFAAILAAGASLALAPAPVAAQAAKPFYGIQIQVTPEGPKVVEVMPGFTADAIGLEVGDILLEAGGKPISQEVLQEYQKDKKVGDELTFKVNRAGAVVELTGKAVAAPEAAPAPPAQPQQ